MDLKPLIIVESPTKARTISGFLGSEFTVSFSSGHIRDLPSCKEEIPVHYQGESWAELGVNIENGYKPIYVATEEGEKRITELKKLLTKTTELYLATDDDREGEAIAWHLIQVLELNIPVHRIVFREITEKAIRHALENPRQINQDLVNAQEARRILDRLIGWGLSPVVKRTVKPNLSAGRVQSPAVRIIVQRERERMNFTPANFWGLEGVFRRHNEEFTASLVSVDGVQLATHQDFDEKGVLNSTDMLVLEREQAATLAEELRGAEYQILSVEEEPFTSLPYPPFSTSTLQQEAYSKYQFGATRTMKAAQALYENGYITYMRTDSTDLSDDAIGQVRQEITRIYRENFLVGEPQHLISEDASTEAIRPAGVPWRTPEKVRVNVKNKDQHLIYQLIWCRTLASQMVPAQGTTTRTKIICLARRPIIIRGKSHQGAEVEFSALRKTIAFPGYQRVYVEGYHNPETGSDDLKRYMPRLKAGEKVTPRRIIPRHHSTNPPARFTEASLLKRMDKLCIGRPSTYASIISSIVDRGYVWKRGTDLVPSVTAFATVALLENYYPDLVDLEFTARMEEDLDKISRGEEAKVPWLKRFYEGNGTLGFQRRVSDPYTDQFNQDKTNTLHIGKDPNGEAVLARVNKFGVHLARGEQSVLLPKDIAPGEINAKRATEILASPRDLLNGGLLVGKDSQGEELFARVDNFGICLARGEDNVPLPKDIAPNEINIKRATELLNAPKEKVLGNDPRTGLTVLVLTRNQSPYIQLGKFSYRGYTPQRASIPKDTPLDQIYLEDALRLLYLPRKVGTHPKLKENIFARYGHGPYLQMGNDTCTLDYGHLLLDITLEEATAQFKILGQDPKTGLPVLVLKGPHCPYIQLGWFHQGRDDGDRPRRVALPVYTILDNLDLEYALLLLSLPRKLGNHPQFGKQIFIYNGRFGPFLKMGDETRSLDEESLRNITLEKAVVLFKQTKKRKARNLGTHPETGENIMAFLGRFGPFLKMGQETRSLDHEQQILDITLEESIARFTKPTVLKELGTDPVSGGKVVVRDGRYGVYVSDGIVNATLRGSDTVENITLGRAAELLEARRERMKQEDKWPPKSR